MSLNLCLWMIVARNRIFLFYLAWCLIDRFPLWLLRLLRLLLGSLCQLVWLLYLELRLVVRAVADLGGGGGFFLADLPFSGWWRVAWLLTSFRLEWIFLFERHFVFTLGRMPFFMFVWAGWRRTQSGDGYFRWTKVSWPAWWAFAFCFANDVEEILSACDLEIWEVYDAWAVHLLGIVRGGAFIELCEDACLSADTIVPRSSRLKCARLISFLLQSLLAGELVDYVLN